jgi:hypothetical protein
MPYHQRSLDRPIKVSHAKVGSNIPLVSLQGLLLRFTLHLDTPLLDDVAHPSMQSVEPMTPQAARVSAVSPAKRALSLPAPCTPSRLNPAFMMDFMRHARSTTWHRHLFLFLFIIVLALVSVITYHQNFALQHIAHKASTHRPPVGWNDTELCQGFHRCNIMRILRTCQLCLLRFPTPAIPVQGDSLLLFTIMQAELSVHQLEKKNERLSRALQQVNQAGSPAGRHFCKCRPKLPWHGNDRMTSHVVTLHDVFLNRHA